MVGRSSPGNALFVLELSDPAALDDAMPYNWGQRAIVYLANPKSQSHLDFLYYGSDHRFGTLDFSLQRDAYSPHPEGPLPELPSIAALANVIERIQHKDKLIAREKLLVQSTKSMDGAHPKALL